MGPAGAQGMQPLANSQPLSVTDVLDRSLVLRTTGTPSGRRSSVASPSNLRRALPAGPSPAGERQLEGLDSQRRPTSASTGLAGSRSGLQRQRTLRRGTSAAPPAADPLSEAKALVNQAMATSKRPSYSLEQITGQVMQELEEAEKWRTDVPERYSGSSFMRRELSLVEREADRRFLQAAQRPSSAPAAPAGLAATQRPRTAEDVLQAALLPAPGAAARRRPATAQLPRAGFGSSAPRLAGAAQSGAAAATLRPGMVTGGARRAEEARALGPGCYGDMQHVGALQWHHEHGTLRPGKEFLHTHSAPVLVTFPKRREHQARVKRASECPGPGHYDPPGALGRPWQCSPAPGKSFARRRPRAAGRGPAAAPAAQ